MRTQLSHDQILDTSNGILISPSMLSADFSALSDELKDVTKAGADWIHVDVMDGHFVPNITLGPDQTADLRKTTDLPFDVHLMIEEPEKYIPRFIDAGADLITVHVETKDDLNRCFDLIEEAGVIPGIVISPDTDPKELEPYLDRVKLILIMSVYPGFGGQSYIPSSTEKIRTIKKMIGDRDILIEVDGGVNFNTVEEIVEAGADVLVSGSCVFHGNKEDNIKQLRTLSKIN